MSNLSQTDLSHLCQGAVAVARKAAEAIMAVYARDFSVQNKADSTPLTEADMAAHAIIDEGLKSLTPRFPVLSEESSARVMEDRKRWSRYWLVDPLDGTREFISKNGEFAVNIALIENGVPTIGVIAMPVHDKIAYGTRQGEAYLQNFAAAETEPQRIVSTSFSANSVPRVAVSRSHHPCELKDALARLGSHENVTQGSSLKFVALACGQADLYPRLGSCSSEWDIAAGQCLLEAAGGALLDLSGQPMRYNQNADLLMPAFVACGDPAINWLSKLGWSTASSVQIPCP